MSSTRQLKRRAHIPGCSGGAIWPSSYRCYFGRRRREPSSAGCGKKVDGSLRVTVAAQKRCRRHTTYRDARDSKLFPNAFFRNLLAV
jgi:hypothetical protein